MGVISMNNKKLYRSKTDCKLCGVCGGFGEYLGIDSNIIRLCWVLFGCMAAAGIVAYIIAAIILPEGSNYQ